jgi:heterodisulfide reductase subunit B
MRFAFFLGCTTPFHLRAYETSSRAVLRALGVDLVDIAEFGCCGYPLKNVDLKASLLSTARNLALARKGDLPILCLCKCGFGTLKQGAAALLKDPRLLDEVNSHLEKEALCYDGRSEVFHMLTVLHKHVGMETIRKKIGKPYKDLKIATHYGCHALRPSEIVRFDDSVAPTLFDELVDATGAESIAWPEKLACCGGPLLGINDSLSLKLTEKKLAGAERAGARFIATACPFCQIQFETVRREYPFGRRENHDVRPVLYSQLLGLCMGLDRETLGLEHGDGSLLEQYLATG